MAADRQGRPWTTAGDKNGKTGVLPCPSPVVVVAATMVRVVKVATTGLKAARATTISSGRTATVIAAIRLLSMEAVVVDTGAAITGTIAGTTVPIAEGDTTNHSPNDLGEMTVMAVVEAISRHNRQ